VELASDPAGRRSVLSRLYFDAAIQVNGTFSILAVTKRLQRQRLQTLIQITYLATDPKSK
jgi:hypothetical protein